MTGWAVAGAVIALLALATAGSTLSRWMQHKSLAAARGDWTRANFLAELAASGVVPAVGTALADALSPLYYADCQPRRADRLTDDLRINSDDLADVIAHVAAAANRTLPEPAPDLATVGDLARYLSDRTSAR